MEKDEIRKLTKALNDTGQFDIPLTEEDVEGFMAELEEIEGCPIIVDYSETETKRPAAKVETPVLNYKQNLFGILGEDGKVN